MLTKRAHRLPSGRILIADDDADQRELYGMVFSARGMMVIDAEDGAVALQRARETKPDVILMDIDMPVMNGIEAIHRLKADERTRAIPVVVLSGTAHHVRARVEEAGAAHCLVKPCLPKDLEGVVFSLVESVELPANDGRVA